MRNLPRLLLGILLIATLVQAIAQAHPDHAFGKPLHFISLEEARELAETEYRIVFVYVGRHGEKTPDFFEQPDWNDWIMLDLLVRETVGIMAGGTQANEIVEQYGVTKLPTVLLLNTDGTERRRLPAPISLAELIDELRRDLSGEDTVKRIRRAVAGGGLREMYIRERLAQALMRAGDYPAACREYLWCLNDGLRQDLTYAAARRRLFLKGFLQLAMLYPPAREALIAWRSAREQELRDNPDDHNLARNWAAVNACLGDREHTLALHDALPERAKARHILFTESMPLMIDKRRYREVLNRVDPTRAFRQDCALARMRGRAYNEGDGAEFERGTRSYAAARAAALVEALGAVGKTDEAVALIQRIVKFYDTPRVRGWLDEGVRRSGDEKLAEFWKSFTKPPPPQTP